MFKNDFLIKCGVGYLFISRVVGLFCWEILVFENVFFFDKGGRIVIRFIKVFRLEYVCLGEVMRVFLSGVWL